MWVGTKIRVIFAPDVFTLFYAFLVPEVAGVLFFFITDLPEYN